MSGKIISPTGRQIDFNFFSVIAQSEDNRQQSMVCWASFVNFSDKFVQRYDTIRYEMLF